MIQRQGNGRLGSARAAVAAFALVTFVGTTLHAQTDQFGGQQRADAAARMIVLGVQQGISSLPPTSGQSLTYEFDPELSTFVASERLGPTAFRSTQTVGQGKWALRASYSYFYLQDDFGPIKYAIEFQDQFKDPSSGRPVFVDAQGNPVLVNNPETTNLPPSKPAGISEFGLKARATVNLINIGFNYGITDRLEMTFNVPITIVEARASQVSTVMRGQENTPATMVQAAGVFQLLPFSEDPATRADQIQGASDEFDACLGRGGQCQTGGFLSQRSDSFSSLGFDFLSDASPGVGRISVGGKFLFLTTRYLLAAFSTEFFAPSPNEAEYAGSASPAILPRLIAQVPLHKYFRLHMDAGYDYDFDQAELRRFVWNGGASVPIGRWVSVDFGAGGSIFDVPIRWTPSLTEGTGPSGERVTATALGDNQLGDEFVDFLGGFKVRLTDSLVLSGSASTPLNSQGFRADAVGTIAIEAYY
jgi:hypothetical protein